MDKVLKILNQPKFDRLLLVWTNVGTNQVCVRDRLNGKSKIITVLN